MVQKQEFYRQTIQEAAASLHTDPKRGLSAQEAERRLWENGEKRDLYKKVKKELAKLESVVL